MNRRLFLRRVSDSLVSGAFAPRVFAVASTSAQHLAADVATVPAVPPGGQLLYFGWHAAPIALAAEAPLVLRWPTGTAAAKVTRLRIAVAQFMRSTCKIEATLVGSGRVLGKFDVRFPSLFQPYEITLAPGDGPAAVREGVALRMTEGTLPFWTWTGGDGCPRELRPHLLAPGTADLMAEFHSRIRSLACLQNFGWEEGCVLDGLLDLAKVRGYQALRDTARRHLALYLRGGKLIYESRQLFSDTEGPLVLAALARLQPAHPLLEYLVPFCREHLDAEGAIIDGNTTTSEGAYTIAYPLALIARVKRSSELERLALTQLRVRQTRLFDGQFFHRTSGENGTKGNRNWARGIAWELLGLAHTLGVLRDRSDIADLLDGFRQLAGWVQDFQRGDGLWSVFVDEQTLEPDTAGSAGIAAALALGRRYSWLPASAGASAQKTLEGLRAHLTPDGFLGGVSPANLGGGEPLQRGDYRVIFQMSMGLMAQLVAALESLPVK